MTIESHNPTTTLALRDPEKTDLEPRSIDEAKSIAIIAAKTGFFGAKSPEEAFVMIATGRELGLSAMQSLRGIYVVKGKPMVSADAMVAILRGSPACKLWRRIESTDTRCTIETQRAGDTEPTRCTWTMEDAKRAGLGGDSWAHYPRTMLRHRCASELAREVYPDLLLGVYCEGEITVEPASVARPADPLYLDPRAVATSDPSALDAFRAAVAEDVQGAADLAAVYRAAKLTPETVGAVGDAAKAWLTEHGYSLCASDVQQLLGGNLPADTTDLADTIAATGDLAGLVRAWTEYRTASAGQSPSPATAVVKAAWLIVQRKGESMGIAKATLKAACEASAPKPPNGGGAPKPEAPATTDATGTAAPAPVDTAAVGASTGATVTQIHATARPGEVITTEGEILATEAEKRAYLERQTITQRVLASACRHHDDDVYRRLAVERYAALCGCPVDAAGLAVESEWRKRSTRAVRAA